MEPLTPEEWTVIEDEDINVEGYMLIPSSGNPTRYIMAGPAKLFPEEAHAREVLSHLTSQGKIPLGSYKVVHAKLAQARVLAVKDVAEPSSLILLR